jgi:hypothetical protein
MSASNERTSGCLDLNSSKVCCINSEVSIPSRRHASFERGLFIMVFLSEKSALSIDIILLFSSFFVSSSFPMFF